MTTVIADRYAGRLAAMAIVAVMGMRAGSAWGQPAGGGPGAGAAADIQPANPATVAVTEGGRPVPLAREGTVCGPVPPGWLLDRERRTIRPPTAGSAAPRRVEVRLAADGQSCERARLSVTVTATGPHPVIAPASVVFAPDEGRLELEGERLAGMQILWRVPIRQGATAGGQAGSETCLDPRPAAAGRAQRCVLPLPPNLPSDTILTWVPPGAPPTEEVRVFDAAGDLREVADRQLKPARMLLSQLVPPSAAVDVSLGPARVPLLHPKAVSAVDCGQARCELVDGAVLVRTVPTPASSLTLRLRLAARVLHVKGDAQESNVTLSLPLVQCPLAVISGPPLRDADDGRVVLRVDPRCAREAERARFTVNGDPVDADDRRVKRVGEALFVVLRVGRLGGERVTIAARRPDLDATIIGSVTASTAPAPRPRVTLELPKHGKVEFIPTNREAVLTVAGAGDRARLVPLPVEGAYSVQPRTGHYLVRGDENAGGFVALRFGYRVEGLPAELGTVDLAVVSERVQRAVREASVPAPFSTSADETEPLVELTCADAAGKATRVAPSRLHRLPLDAKDTCRVHIHRQRLRAEWGLQEVLLEVEVSRSDGTRRSEPSFTERMILTPGGEPRVVPLKGGVAEFDRILVRLAHVLDETRYALSPTGRQGLPSVQWVLAIEGGRLRLYATAAIPAGLYRMNKPTGQLTLNFGILSRITWLDDHGKEGLFGAEIGLMGMGLIQRPGAIEYPPTIGAVGGFGIRVPLGGGAAVGVHVWGAYEFRDDFNYYPDTRNMSVSRRAPKWAFIFGPSISIGNVGVNL